MSQTPVTDVERLLQEIETLDQRLRVLQRKLEIEREHLNRAIKFSCDFHEIRFEGGATSGDRRTERDLLTACSLLSE